MGRGSNSEERERGESKAEARRLIRRGRSSIVILLYFYEIMQLYIMQV